MACTKCNNEFFKTSTDNLNRLFNGDSALVTCSNDECNHQWLQAPALETKAGEAA